jgi:hypothetical protein
VLVTKDFVLIHVPKTGGTFLNDLIKEHCDVLHDQMHGPYSELPDEYRDLPALGFVRNPWDWYVSWFEHMKQKGPQSKDEWEWEKFRLETATFPEFLELAFDLPHGYDYYSAVLRNFLDGCQHGRFEHLREWFVRFLSQHRIVNPGLARAVLEAPPSNVGQHRPYWDYYDPHTAQLIWQSWTAQTFGYAFEREIEIPLGDEEAAGATELAT